jgi:hypothetical protein
MLMRLASGGLRSQQFEQFAWGWLQNENQSSNYAWGGLPLVRFTRCPRGLLVAALFSLSNGGTRVDALALAMLMIHLGLQLSCHLQESCQYVYRHTIPGVFSLSTKTMLLWQHHCTPVCKCQQHPGILFPAVPFLKCLAQQAALIALMTLSSQQPVMSLCH